MKLLRTGFAVIAASSILCVSATAATIAPNYKATPTTATPSITPSTTTHAIFLKCRVNETLLYQSKGAILALPTELEKSGKDVALVTGHGLDASSNCYVSDFSGNSKQVLSFSLAKNYQAGTDTDWALITFETIKGDHIQRYDVDSVLPDVPTLDNKSVRFAQARGLPENNQSCRLADTIYKGLSNTGNIIGHNCRAIGGQSGSPMTQIIDGRHNLIGFHIGSGWTIESPMTGKPGRLNFMRYYDAKMAAEVKQALREKE